jgi:hypothetical protein
MFELHSRDVRPLYSQRQVATSSGAETVSPTALLNSLQPQAIFLEFRNTLRHISFPNLERKITYLGMK